MVEEEAKVEEFCEEEEDRWIREDCRKDAKGSQMGGVRLLGGEGRR